MNQSLPTIKVIGLDEFAISQHDLARLTEFCVGETRLAGIMLEYGGRKIRMVPALKELREAAEDVVLNHTRGIDAMQDQLIDSLVGAMKHV